MQFLLLDGQLIHRIGISRLYQGPSSLPILARHIVHPSFPRLRFSCGKSVSEAREEVCACVCHYFGVVLVVTGVLEAQILFLLFLLDVHSIVIEVIKQEVQIFFVLFL